MWCLGMVMVMVVVVVVVIGPMAAQTRRGILFVVVETSRMVIPFTTPVTAPHLDTDPRQAIHTFVNCTQSIKKEANKVTTHSTKRNRPSSLTTDKPRTAVEVSSGFILGHVQEYTPHLPSSGCRRK